MDILKPLLSESDAVGAGTYVIGTVSKAILKIIVALLQGTAKIV